MATLETKRSDAARPPLLSRTLALVFITSFGTLSSFYLLLSVVPQYAASLGAGGTGAGFSTGALMLTTVLVELATPLIIAGVGYRWVQAAGFVLMGAPVLLLPRVTGFGEILAISLVRGVGFAMLVVASSALVALLVPSERRAEGLGLYGVVVGVPAIVGLPLGVWLVAHVGYAPVFWAGALCALAGLLAVPAFPGHEAKVDVPVGIVAGLRNGAVVRPGLIFSVTAMAGGIVATFLPLAVTQADGNVAALGLFVQATTSTVSRWWAGHHGDRRGSAGLLMPSVLVTALGVGVIAWTSSSAAVIAGMALLGAGFGVAQNASLALMFERVPTSGYDMVSAVWNLAFDAGMGIGASAFGVLVGHTGYGAAFLIMAGVMCA